jgi:hypothetical protein
LDIGGGVMRRPNDTDNLHKLTRSYPALTAFFFVFFFYKYQNTLDPTQIFLKKIRVEKTPITLKTKAFVLKSKDILIISLCSRKEKTKKVHLPK